MSAFDGLIVVLTLLGTLGAGVLVRFRGDSTIAEHLLAGRSLTGLGAGLSMVATQLAPDTPLVFTGIIATQGLHGLWIFWSFSVAYLFHSLALAPVFRRMGALTDVELTELRHPNQAGAALRGVKATLFGLLSNVLTLAWVMTAAGVFGEALLPWDAWLGALAGDAAGDWGRWLTVSALAAVAALYSSAGGLRAVVVTDVVQAGLALLGTLSFAGVLLAELGGFEALGRSLSRAGDAGQLGGLDADQLLSLAVPADTSWSALAGLALLWLYQPSSDGSGFLAQRSLACRTDRSAALAGVSFTFIQTLLRSLPWMVIGLGLLVLLPPEGSVGDPGYLAAREQSFVDGMVTLLPPGLLGLMVAGVVAALVSTVDSHLHWGSGILVHDVFVRFVARRDVSEGQHVRAQRVATLLLLALAMALSATIDAVLDALLLGLLFGAGMGAAQLLRWLWWRVTAAAELAAALTSIVGAVVLLAVPGLESLERVLIAGTLGLVVTVAVSLVRAPRPDELVALYRRSRPVGFWDPVEKAAGVAAGRARGRLLRGLAATALWSLSLFACLALMCGVVFGTPAPGDAPRWIAWPALALAGAAPFGLLSTARGRAWLLSPAGSSP